MVAGPPGLLIPIQVLGRTSTISPTLNRVTGLFASELLNVAKVDDEAVDAPDILDFTRLDGDGVEYDVELSTDDEVEHQIPPSAPALSVVG
jgi:hypothetical protein